MLLYMRGWLLRINEGVRQAKPQGVLIAQLATSKRLAGCAGMVHCDFGLLGSAHQNLKRRTMQLMLSLLPLLKASSVSLLAAASASCKNGLGVSTGVK